MQIRTLMSLALLLVVGPLNAQTTFTRGNNMTVDIASDGRVVIDLLGELWIVPGNGGDARQLTDDLESARRPGWSPDGQQIVFQANVSGQRGLWIHDVRNGDRRRISDGDSFDIHPSWHPDGDKVIYSSDVDGRGFDLWEVDVPTGLHWKLSSLAGDETEAAWSADGRDLVYVHSVGDVWTLVLRRHAQAEEILLSSRDRLFAPSWRPDGSLITFLRDSDGDAGDNTSLDMVILSSPRLVRRYDVGEQFVLAPISWLDRQQFIYSANGQIRKRRFGDWRSKPLPFRATVQARAIVKDDRVRPNFVWPNEPDGNFVIHAQRIFDGVTPGYQHDKDIRINGGRIVSVGAHLDHGSSIAIDMGDLTILPGFIDANARLPTALGASHGPDLLTTGVTTIVASHADAERLNLLWSNKDTPGPRFLAAEHWPSGPVSPAELDVTAAVVSSRSTGLVTGEALPIQFRSMAIAGLDAEQTLRAIGVNAAALLLADPYLGRLAAGSAADLVFVDGDPLANTDDALNVVAVVRNGRFFSVSGLFDRAKSAETVD